MRTIIGNFTTFLSIWLYFCHIDAYQSVTADKCQYTGLDTYGHLTAYSYAPYNCYTKMACDCNYIDALKLCRKNNAMLARMSPHDTFGPLYFELFGTNGTYDSLSGAWITPVASGCRSFTITQKDRSMSYQEITNCDTKLKYVLCMKRAFRKSI